MTAFLDTSVILRYLLPEDMRKTRASLALLQRVEQGEEVLETADTVIFEAVFVLESPRQYKLPREQVRALLEPVTQLAGLALPNKNVYPKAFQLYVEKRIDFADAFHAAYMEARGMSEVYSYDQHFDHIEGVVRLEPPMV